ncbi:hypothetical protein Hanom_Chr01g00026181 [Helianthus anomalus]
MITEPKSKGHTSQNTFKQISKHLYLQEAISVSSKCLQRPLSFSQLNPSLTCHVTNRHSPPTLIHSLHRPLPHLRR